MGQAHASCQGYASLQYLHSPAPARPFPQLNTEATAPQLESKEVSDAMLPSEEVAKACRRWGTSHRQRGQGCAEVRAWCPMALGPK